MSDRLAEIQARLDAATSGPLTVTPIYDEWPGRRSASPDVWIVEETMTEGGHDAIWQGGFEKEADAVLAAHAPDDLRWLIERNARLERLAKAAQEIQDADAAMTNDKLHDEFHDDFEALRAALALLGMEGKS